MNTRSTKQNLDMSLKIMALYSFDWGSIHSPGMVNCIVCYYGMDRQHSCLATSILMFQPDKKKSAPPPSLRVKPPPFCNWISPAGRNKCLLDEINDWSIFLFCVIVKKFQNHCSFCHTSCKYGMYAFQLGIVFFFFFLNLFCFPAEEDKNSSQSSNLCMLHFPVGFVKTLGGTCSV